MKAVALCHRGALLGTAVTMLLACGGGERGPAEEGVEGSGARITALGPAIVNDCSVGLAFDITAPSAIGLVGVAPLGNIAQAPELALYSVDAWGREQLVATEATSVNGVTLALVAQAQTANTLVTGDDVSTFQGTGQASSIGFGDSLRNGTTYTSSESGSYARDSYGNQALLQESLAAAGWEPVSHATDFLVTSIEQGDSTTLAQAGRVTDSQAGTVGSANQIDLSSLGFDTTAGTTNQWANRDVGVGIGRLNVRESWGNDQMYSSMQGADAFGNANAQSTASQASSTGVGTQTSAIRNAWAIQSLESLDSRHFVLRVQAVATGGPAGLRVFQGTESALYAASDVSVPLPACGN